MVHAGSRCGRSPAIDVHVRPKSVLFNRYGLKLPRWKSFSVTYTVFASTGEGCTPVTYVISGTPGNIAILRQFAPPSSETCTTPSSVPTNSTPSFTGDS